MNTRINRNGWEARAPEGSGTRMRPSLVRGLAIHWPALTKPAPTSQDAVAALLRSFQDFHMDQRGWRDIAYQEAVDLAGRAYALRGFGLQSAANGDEEVNQRFGALLLMIGPGQPLTPAMIDTVRRRVTRFGEKYPGAVENRIGRSRTVVVTHNDVRPEPTTCPGPAATSAVHAGVFNPWSNR